MFVRENGLMLLSVKHPTDTMKILRVHTRP